MTYNCLQLAQNLQSLKEVFSVLKNQLAEFEAINSSPDVSRAKKIAKLKELYQIRKQLQEIYPPWEIIITWAEKYLEKHTTSRKIAQTQEQALSGKYLIYLGDIICQDLKSAEGLKFPKIVGGFINLNALTDTNNLKLPDFVGKSLGLSSLIHAENLELPKKILGELYLNNLSNAKRLILPDYLCDHIYLGSLESVDFLKLPKAGYISFFNLKSIKEIAEIKDDYYYGSLIFPSLTSIENIKLPKRIIGSLFFYKIDSAKGLVLPEFISENLYFKNLTSIEGLDLSNLDLCGAIYFGKLPEDEFKKLILAFPNIRMEN